MSKCGARQATTRSSLIGWLERASLFGDLQGEFDTPRLALEAGIQDAKGLLTPADSPL